mgnify:CR=1 FL=1
MSWPSKRFVLFLCSLGIVDNLGIGTTTSTFKITADETVLDNPLKVKKKGSERGLPSRSFILVLSFRNRFGEKQSGSERN